MKEKTGKEFYVQGMHCSACEVLLERTLKRDRNVVSVKASLKNRTVSISPKTNLSDDDIERMNDTLSEYGYTLLEEKPQEEGLTETALFKGILIFVLFFAAFLAIERSGFIIGFDVNSKSNYWGFFLFGIAAGVSSCAALVGGLLLSLSKKWTDLYGGNTKKAIIPFIQFNIGRLISFAVLGGLLGVIGSAFKISVITTSILTLVVSLVMILMGLQLLNIKLPAKIAFPTPKILDRFINNDFDVKGRHIPFLIGALTFFVPCGFTLVAQTSALSSGNFVRSGLSLLAFSLGTLPVLAIISFTSVKMYSNQILSKTFSFVAGLLVLFFAIYTINSQLNLLGVISLSDVTALFSTKGEVQKGVSQQNGKETVQVIKMVGKDFEYFPKTIELKVGVPARIEFDNQGVIGCATVVSMRGLYDGFIKLNPGVNKVDFTPTKTGNFKITCSMGMVPPVNVIVK